MINASSKSGISPLMAAVNFQKEWWVQALIELGADGQMKDKEGWTPLMMAVVRHNEEIVKHCLKTPVDLNAVEQQKENTALMLALEEKQWNHALLLIEAGADVNRSNKKGQTPLMLAAQQQQDELVEALLSKGAEIHAWDKDQQSVLCYALKSRQTTIIDRLWSEEWIAQKDWRALEKALEWGNVKVIEKLLEKGCTLSEKNHNEDALLIMAVKKSPRNKVKEIVQILLEKGVDVHEKNKHGNNALMLAVDRGLEEVVDLLLQKEININDVNREGETALHWAASINHAPIVDRLLQKGADPQIMNKHQQKALDFIGFKNGLTGRLLKEAVKLEPRTAMTMTEDMTLQAEKVIQSVKVKP